MYPEKAKTVPSKQVGQNFEYKWDVFKFSQAPKGL